MTQEKPQGEVAWGRPWKVAEPIDGGVPAVYPDTGKMEFPVCVKPDFMRADAWHEIARLIAAAPELYEGAAAAVDLLEQYAHFICTVKADDIEQHPYLPHVEQVLEDLRAALHKARTPEGLTS